MHATHRARARHVAPEVHPDGVVFQRAVDGKLPHTLLDPPFRDLARACQVPHLRIDQHMALLNDVRISA